MKKITAVLLSLMLVLGAVAPAMAEGAYKDETVYVLATGDGEARKVIVSDWLKNPEGAETLADATNLADVENVKGDEAFDGSAWAAAGKDIYYQGTSEEPLPVQMKITYTLDGEALSAEEIAGKSGRVTIRFDYLPQLTGKAAVGETEETMYVPFAVVTAALLDNDVFTNVEVENGYLVNDGDHSVAAGVVLPGMQENLDLDPETLELPAYIEISADAENFALPLTLSVATNELFSYDGEADASSMMDDLNEAVGKLTDAMAQLLDGGSQLADGLETLLAKAGELSDGVSALSTGLETLDENSAALTDGSAQVFDSLLSVANSQLAAAGQDVTLTKENYSEALDALLEQTDVEAAAREQVETAVRAREDEVRAAVAQAVEQEVSAKVTQAVQDGVTEQVLATMNLTPEAYQAAAQACQVTEQQQAQIEGAVSAQMKTDEVQALVSQQTQAQMASDEVTALIASNTEAQVQALIEQNMASDEVQKQMAAASAQAEAARETLTALKAQLDSYNTFYTGLAAYTQGVTTAAGGAKTLNDSMPALISGVTELRDGAKALSDGIAQFNEEGVTKLADAVNDNLNGLADRLEAMCELSKTYSNYSGIADGMEGSVRFVWRTDAVESK